MLLKIKVSYVEFQKSSKLIILSNNNYILNTSWEIIYDLDWIKDYRNYWDRSEYWLKKDNTILSGLSFTKKSPYCGLVEGCYIYITCYNYIWKGGGREREKQMWQMLIIG